MKRCNVCQRYQVHAGLCRVCLPELLWWCAVAFVCGFGAMVVSAAAMH